MEVWRDISLMWLILLTLIAALPFGVVFFLAIKGMHRLRQLAKRHLPPVQEQFGLVAAKSEEISEQVARPVVELHARAAQVDTIARTILRRNRT